MFWVNSEQHFGKSAGQLALASPHFTFWDIRAPVIYAREPM